MTIYNIYFLYIFIEYSIVLWRNMMIKRMYLTAYEYTDFTFWYDTVIAYMSTFMY